MSQPVPGWYPDPAGSPRLRLWNGGIWTDQYLPMPGTQPQQGTPAPMRGVPLPYNAAMQQGAPQAQGASYLPATPTRKGRAHPPCLPSQQAPKVHSNPYQNTGITPIFSDSENSANETHDEQENKPRTGSGWFIGLVAAWIAVVLFAASAVYASMAFTRASKELADAESEHASAQSEYNEAQSGLDKAKKDLEETQK